jgi:hypothetical protein
MPTTTRISRGSPDSRDGGIGGENDRAVWSTGGSRKRWLLACLGILCHMLVPILWSLLLRLGLA